MLAEVKNPSGDGGNGETVVSGTYLFRKGDTLDLVASRFGLSVHSIVAKNAIDDERKLAAGDLVVLPEKRKSKSEESKAGIRLEIKASPAEGRVPLRVSFDFADEPPADATRFVWDFGNGIYSFERNPGYTYKKPGTYPVSCTAFADDGVEIESESVEVRAAGDRLTSGGIAYLTVDGIYGVLDLGGRAADKLGNPAMFGGDALIIQEPALIQPLGMNLFLATATGYSMITLESGDASYTFDLFVSPYPSEHSVEPEFDWYKTQFETGIWGNCGPACVAMVVHWATGDDITVEESREEIGMPYPKGALTYENMIANFTLHRLVSFKKKATLFKDISEVIDDGHVAIILFDTTYIRPVKGDKRTVFTDRYYPDTTGHYVVIKGYSLDEKYFIVYDPIPGDWQENEPRYTDGVSMIGRNRYFLADEIIESIRSKEILVIERP